MSILLAFIGITAILALLGPDKERPVWAVLFGMSSINLGLNETMFADMDSVWVVVAAGMLELVTCYFIVKYAWGRLAAAQVLLLFVAWCGHMALIFDVMYDNTLIYDHYSTYISAVIIAQLSLGTNGLLDIASNATRRLWTRFNFLDSRVPVRTASSKSNQAS